MRTSVVCALVGAVMRERIARAPVDAAGKLVREAEDAPLLQPLAKCFDPITWKEQGYYDDAKTKPNPYDKPGWKLRYNGTPFAYDADDQCDAATKSSWCGARLYVCGDRHCKQVPEDGMRFGVPDGRGDTGGMTYVINLDDDAWEDKEFRIKEEVEGGDGKKFELQDENYYVLRRGNKVLYKPDATGTAIDQAYNIVATNRDYATDPPRDTVTLEESDGIHLPGVFVKENVGGNRYVLLKVGRPDGPGEAVKLAVVGGQLQVVA